MLQECLLPWNSLLDPTKFEGRIPESINPILSLLNMR